MNRLRNRLILVFLAATLAPLAATLWITQALLDESLRYASTDRVDALSRSLERTGREYYRQARQALHAEAAAGRLTPRVHAASGRARWPDTVAEFAASPEPERFRLAGERGMTLELLTRRGGDILVYSTPLGVAMDSLTAEYRDARRAVEQSRGRDLRRGFSYTLALLSAAVWVGALLLLVYLAHRVSRPIQDLTQGLRRLSGGDLSARVAVHRDDEIGRAVVAFNHMAAELERSTERLVYLTQVASWQQLARKMAHEVKNSLTPIRLTVEEMVARSDAADRAFLDQAAQIVVEEVESLERRVRAFSEFSGEPPLRLGPLDAGAAVAERTAFLKSAHPEVEYRVENSGPALALADEDLVRSIVTNLLENAAEAAGPGGRVLARAATEAGSVVIEVHDSGPGLSEDARLTLFQPSISFKKRGMGLGLSIARKSALRLGGDIVEIAGELGGAAFRVVLPAAARPQQKAPALALRAS